MKNTKALLATIPQWAGDSFLKQRKEIGSLQTRLDKAERQVRDMGRENRRLKAVIAELESR